MEVEIKFEPSGLTGIVAVGSYLSDAAARMGIHTATECGRGEHCDSSCVVEIIKGKELLSELTAAEIERLTEEQRSRGLRLSCQAKIEKQGELVVMVEEKQQTEEEKEAERKRKARKEFEELPLEQKISNLLELELITLSETFSFILNSPYAVAGKVMDVMAQFGLKMDNDAKKAKRPSEHGGEEAKTEEGAAEEKKDHEPEKPDEKAQATEPVNEAS